MPNDVIAYALGHSGDELDRLQKQAEFYAEFTRLVLLKAGLQPGMRVLDVGCGVGDVSMEAARIVGAAGEVVGVDQSGAALEIAASRALSAGLKQARFQNGDLLAAGAGQSFDAVVGRFILLHLSDPAAALAALVERVRTGGRVAFIEMDLTSAQAFPPLPIFTQAVGWISEVYRRDGVTIDMGAQLFACYAALGLKPELEAFQRIEGGPDAQVYDYLAQTVRSLAPRILKLGVASADALDLDTLAARTRAAALEGDHCFFYPRMVGAWARKP